MKIIKTLLVYHCILALDIFRIRSGWQAVRGLLQSVSLEDTEDCGGNWCGNMCKPWAATALPDGEMALAGGVKIGCHPGFERGSVAQPVISCQMDNIGNALQTESASNLYIRFESTGPRAKPWFKMQVSRRDARDEALSIAQRLSMAFRYKLLAAYHLCWATSVNLESLFIPKS